MKLPPSPDVIVMGASASIVVVLHMLPAAESLLDPVLSNVSPLRARRVARKSGILRAELTRRADERERHARLIRKLLVENSE